MSNFLGGNGFGFLGGAVSGGGGGGGTVTSVGFAAPASVFSVAGSPVTGSGTITASFISQTANRFFAAPSGGNGVPSFRAIVPADVPGLVAGTAPLEVGIVVNDTFPGTSLSANWSGGLPTGASVNNSLIVTSGMSDWSRYIQLVQQVMYEKCEFTIDFTANSKNAGDGFGITMNTQLVLNNAVIYLKVNLSNDSNSGRVSMGTSTAANEYGYSQPCDFSVGDDMRLSIRRTPWKTTIILENLTDVTIPKAYGSFSNTTLNLINWGTQGKYRLAFLGGQQTFTLFKANVRETNYQSLSGVVFAGDSITAGSGATTVDRRWTNIAMKSQQHKFTNVAVGSWLIGTWNTYLSNEVLPAVNAKYLVLSYGFNDMSQGTALATFEAEYDSAVTYAQGLGYTVILISITPSTTVNEPVPYNTRIQNVATARGCQYIDVYTELQVGGVINPQYSYDTVHLNDSGYAVYGNRVFLDAPDIFQNIMTDINNTPVIAYNLPLGLETFDLLVIDPYSVVHRVSREQWLNNGYIRLQTFLFEEQPGNAWIAGIFKTGDGSYYQQVSNDGLRIGFNNGVDDTAGSNINITNAGAAGIGNVQGFDTITGFRNILVKSVSNKAGLGAGTLAGNDNILFGGSGMVYPSGNNNIGIGLGGTTFSLTTGSNNIWLGQFAGRSITTGGENFHAILRNAGAANIFAPSLTGTVIIGDIPQINIPANNDVFICGSNSNLDQRFYFGDGACDNNYMKVSATWAGADRNGSTWYFRASEGRGAGEPGPFIYQHTTPVASGTTLQTTWTTTMQIDRTRVYIGSGRNLVLGGTVAAASATNSFHVYSGTAPSGSITDGFVAYSADIVAGNAALHVRTENGDIVKIYAIGGWGTPSGTLTRTTFDSGTVTLPELAERVAALLTDLKTGQQLLKA